MKTPDEIKKGLECCRYRFEDHILKSCASECPYLHDGKFSINALHGDALAYIQQLEGERNAVMLDYTYESGFTAGFKAAYPKWISVDEDIPVNTDDVLVLIGGKDVDVGYFEGHEGCWRTYGCVVGAVTHWMPLPEPPKEG